MKRLALVVPVFPRLSETFIVSKFLGLLDAGWDVHIVCQTIDSAAWAVYPDLERWDLRRRVHVAAPHESRLAAAARWLPENVGAALRAPDAARRYWARGRSSGARLLKQAYLDAPLIALRPDIVHFEFGSLAVGRAHLKERLNSKFTVSFRGYDLHHVGLEQPSYYQDVWAAADGLHLLGENLWEWALRRGCPPDMPHVLIPPAIDTAFFIPGTARQERPAGAPLRILSVGRLDWKKGYEYGLDAVRLLREAGVAVEYRVIGAGAYLEPLAFCRYQLGLEGEVDFLGGQPRAEVRDHMAWADVFLHPAVSEGFCNAVIEAQAMELAIVSSDAGGLVENVADGETGFVVPRRDAAALADKLSVLAADPGLRRRMGEAGRARVERCFRLPDQIAAFDRFYSRMVGHD